jgi:hypothetical protein
MSYNVDDAFERNQFTWILLLDTRVWQARQNLFVSLVFIVTEGSTMYDV